MIRIIILAIVTAVTPALATANSLTPSYRLTTATTEVNGRIIVRGHAWTCRAGECVAPHTGSRDNIVCARAARKLGMLTSFMAGNRAFTATELAQCNTGSEG